MEDKNTIHKRILNFSKEIDYSDNSIVSKRIVEKKTGNISLFAFDKEQALSEHTAPFDAIVQIIEGKADIMIDKECYKLCSGEAIIMPANIPHSVKASEKFKMLLTMIKEINL